MQICFIIGKPRSGTTVFKEMLANHPNIVNFGEIFNENNGQSFFEFLKARVSEDADWLLPSRRGDAFLAYLDHCTKKAADSNNQATTLVVDVKYDQSHLVYEAWRDMNAIPSLFALIKSSGWSVIDIRRNGIADMIISNLMAIRTGVYQRALAEPPNQELKFKADLLHFERMVISTRESYRRIERYFAGYERYLKLIYEDMFDSGSGDFSQGILKKASTFLGVDDLFDPQPRLQKLLRPDSLSYVENAEDVRALLARLDK
jgi:hypothetical protein